MPRREFVRRTRVEAPTEEVFAWHKRPGALERLLPPWSGARVVRRTGGIESGARVEVELPVGPRKIRWVVEHRDYVENRQFRDVQVSGPFAEWIHTHRFEPDGPSACWIEDRVEYSLPLGGLGDFFGERYVRHALERTFAYRHRVLACDLETHRTYGLEPRHVAVSGSSGLVGAAASAFLATGGHRLTRLVRGVRSGTGVAFWDPETGAVDTEALAGVDTVLHLAGEPIVGRWTASKKDRILRSRVQGTRALSEALATMPRKPDVLVSASAIGFYGDRADEWLTEESPPGSGFLAEVCRQWEAATEKAEAAGIRVVHLRIGVVLSAAGGALAAMLPAFRWGAGGVLGTGLQFLSWISLDDLLGVVLHAVARRDLVGPVNAVAPEPVTNREFTRVLGRVLGRPTLLPLPTFAARLAFGEAADELLLASARVRPARLLETGFSYRDPDLETALRSTLGRLT
ncbi:MAG: hypothetical protein KatS3mg076_0814 [Candidatus Binatia bacterium]|nr:MAG: hypothetical protein KatS3mg076_0814 [Candidatus Binatia bacterium]